MVQTSFQTQSSRPMYPGVRYGGAAQHKARSMVNDLGMSRQVMDITVDTAADATAYAATVNGIVITITSGTGATEATIRDAWIEEFRTRGEFEGVVTANPYSTNKIRLTAMKPGVAFTASDADGNLTTTTVTANVAQVWLPFGRAIVLANSAVAQVATITVTSDANTQAHTFTVAGTAPDGDAVPAQTVTFTSDGSGTKEEIRNGLLAALAVLTAPGGPLDGVAVGAAVSTDGLSVTSLQPGRAITVAESDANLTLAATTANVVASAGATKSARLPSGPNQNFRGVLERDHSIVDPSNAGIYPYGAAAPGMDLTVGKEGWWYVEVEGAVQEGQVAYYRHASGSGGTDLGKWRADSDSGTCTRTECKFESSTTGAGIAVLDVKA